MKAKRLIQKKKKKNQVNLSKKKESLLNNLHYFKLLLLFFFFLKISLRYDTCDDHPLAEIQRSQQHIPFIERVVFSFFFF